MTQEIIEKPMNAECAMKQYEAIPDADFVENREYQLTDYPDNGANADQMAFALTCQRLFPAGTVVTFSGVTDDNYTNGHLYQIEVDDSGAKSWKDITPAGEQSIPVLVGTQDKPINLATDLEVGKWYILRGNIYSLNKSKVFESDILIYKISTDKCSTLFVNHSGALGTNDSMFTRDNSVLSLNLNDTGEVTSVDHRFIPYVNGTNLLDSPTLTIYAPTDTPDTELCVATATYSQRTPKWKQVKYLATKQQTYYLTELPTTTTSPYAEHDQVVVNNQDVYALEKVDNTLTWVKKYSVGGDESIVTLVGTQDNPITPDMLTETNKLYLLSGYINVLDSTSNTIIQVQTSRHILARKADDDINSALILFYNTFFNTLLHNFQQNSRIVATGCFNVTKDGVTAFGNFATSFGLSSLNGTQITNATTSFYAPITSGTANQVLQSNGSGNAPSWTDLPEQPITTLTGTTDSPITPSNFTKNGYYLLSGTIALNTGNVTFNTPALSSFAGTKLILYGFKVTAFGTIVPDSDINTTELTVSDTTFTVSAKTSGISFFNGEEGPTAVSIYAPESSGTVGQVLQSNGQSKAPSWVDMPAGSTVDTELADSENPVQNKAIYNALKDKLGVLGPDEHNRVYIRKDNTTDSSLPFSYTAEADSIMKRNASGQVQVATPIQDEDAVNKSYADNLQRYMSLTGDSGVLEDEQYELVQQNDNLIIQRVGLDFRRCGYPSNGSGDYIFFCDHYTKPNGSEDWLDYFITIKQDKTWETTIKNHLQIAEQTYAPFVQLDPDTATQGNLSDDDYTNLTEHDDVYIILNNEYYRKADNQHTTGIISYTHQGWNGDTPQDKSINITVSTKAWTLVVGKTKYYRHYIQLSADNKTLYYDFSSTQETAYTADTLPSMPDDIITAFQVVANGYYSPVSGLVYRNSENELKVIMHGMYTTDGTNMSYLQMTGTAATFVQDIVRSM